MRIVTDETCPQCDHLDASCEHGRGSTGQREHVWNCPTCGRYAAIVGWDCPDCPPVVQKPLTADQKCGKMVVEQTPGAKAIT